MEQQPASAVSRRAREITPFLVMDILERAQELERAGEHIIHLEIGEPDYDTPQVVKEAAYRAMAAGETQYTHSQGLMELREALCRHYWDKYRVSVTPEQFIVTSGTSPAMILIFGALLDPGDEVLLPDLHYACYPNVLKLVDAVPRYVPVAEADGFQLNPATLGPYLTPRTKAVLINSPGNPSGTLMPPEWMARLADLGRYVISDEIYHGLVYEGQEHSILEFTDKAFVINGFSKLYAMTGWRLGYLLAPPDFIRPLQKLMQNFFISANPFVQRAGIAALTQAGGEIEAMRVAYDARRRFLLAGLARLGFRIPVPPTGAFYVMVNARHLSADSYALAFDILEKAKVGVAPGADFGPGGEGFLRFSYANSLENLAEALGRLETYLAQRALDGGISVAQEQLSHDAAIDFLTQETVGHLATCDSAGHPYITPINYVYYQDKVYFHGAPEGRKLDNLAANNRVCFEVSRIDKMVFGPVACACSTRYTSVLVFGTGSVVEDMARKIEILHALTEKFAAGRPIPPLHAEAASRCTVVEIAVASIHGKRNVDPEAS